jgi:starch-binding outer membrane protein, SusD/RagB family
MKKMRTIKIIFYMLSGLFLFSSCEEYLERTPEAQVSEKDIFGTYADFQGFLDPNYPEIIDYPQLYLWNDWNCGGEVTDFSTGTNTGAFIAGNYWTMVGPSNSSILLNFRNTYGYGVAGETDKNTGIWYSGWRGIRRCNICIKNLNLLSEATQEEKDLLEGQIYFFRGFFHAEIITYWGGMPYVDSVFNASDELRMPRLSYLESTKRAVADYDKAIPLLPENWDSTTVGKQRIGANAGRITKGAALAYKQKALLYAASPLMNNLEGNGYIYNVELCKQAAAAGWEVIKLANKGVYSLVPWAKYTDQFYKIDGTMPWTTETILQRVERQSGASRFTSAVRRIYVPASFGGTEYCHGVDQLFVDRFEMADGTRYQAPAYDTDPTKRWNNRDPRFRMSILCDRDKWGNHVNAYARLWEGNPTGSDKNPAGQAPLPYLVKKYWPSVVNEYDKGYNSFRYINPRMRLAEVYLDYAEAVTAAYGPNGTAPGSTLTAVDAINIIRARAGMPPVTAAATGYSSFMELVWNERTVELCFESHYWFDIRRWYIAHLPQYKTIYDLKFDYNWTYFTRVPYQVRVFEDPKHYWLPLPKDIVFLYKEMYQNDGWN